MKNLCCWGFQRGRKGIWVTRSTLAEITPKRYLPYNTQGCRLWHAVPYKKKSPLWRVGKRNISSDSQTDWRMALPNVASDPAAICSIQCLTKVRSLLHISADQIAKIGVFLKQTGDTVRLPKKSALTFREKGLPASWQHCKRNLGFHFEILRDRTVWLSNFQI